MMIYHFCPAADWAAAGALYKAPSLETQGFIHCSFAEQVAWAANRFYADQQDLLVVHLDPHRLNSPVREEACDMGEIFPHIYGPINRDAVVMVHPLTRGADGRWQFSGS